MWVSDRVHFYKKGHHKSGRSLNLPKIPLHKQGWTISSIKVSRFWHKWRISAPDIVFLQSRNYRFVQLQDSWRYLIICIGNEIVNYNPRCTYCPLVPKRDTFYATDGTPLCINHVLCRGIWGKFSYLPLFLIKKMDFRTFLFGFL